MISREGFLREGAEGSACLLVVLKWFRKGFEESEEVVGFDGFTFVVGIVNGF